MEQEEHIFTKKDLCKILNVNERLLKKIEYEGQLESRLRKVGYTLYMKKKEGRKAYYLCLETKDKEAKDDYNDFCSDNGIRKKEEFAMYVETRIINIDAPVSKIVIANKASVNEHTITAWDKKLISLGLLSKDGWFYMAIDYQKVNGEIKPIFRLTDEYEYKAHTKIKAKKARLLKKHKNDEVDDETFEIAFDALVKAEESFNGTFVYKLNKFKVKDMQQVENVMLMIKEVYNLRDEDFKITYETSMVVEEYSNDFLEENYNKLDKNI